MKFAAIIEYSQDRDKIQAHRPVHRQYLAALKERGQLVASAKLATTALTASRPAASSIPAWWPSLRLPGAEMMSGR
jgi:hypothetical protein